MLEISKMHISLYLIFIQSIVLRLLYKKPNNLVLTVLMLRN